MAVSRHRKDLESHVVYDAIVVGGGVIGLSIARALAPDRSVLVVDRASPARESSWAAAGMLCPHSEAEECDPLLALGLASLRAYREFARELLEETGVDIEYRDDGVLVLASEPGELRVLKSRLLWLQARCLDVSPLSPEEVRRLEPALSLEIQGAMHCPGDHQVRPRLLMKALLESCAIRGVKILEGISVQAVLEHAGRVEGVRTSVSRLAAQTVIVAAGAWVGQIEGMQPQIPMSPRKGQILALKMPGHVFRHVIRWGRFYFVPRRDQELVVGATDEDCGFDRSVTVAGVGGLLAGAQRLSADVGAYPVVDTWTGLRPMTADGLPAIGATEIGGLFFAVGHYRNGILLAPGTAGSIAEMVRGGNPDPDLSSFSPLRFVT